jgi:hypothetical protein
LEKNDHDDKIYIVCYPGGSGGRFLGAILNAALYDRDFVVDPEKGHCHDSKNTSRPLANFHHGDSIHSFQEELDCIKQFRLCLGTVYTSHCRNLVAVHSKIYDDQGYETAKNLEFIKINVAPTHNHARFLATMLQRKTSVLADIPLQELIDRTQDYIDHWYWVENSRIQNIINITLRDVFTPGLATQFSKHLTQNQIQKFTEYHQSYLEIQNTVHPDLMALLQD